MLMLERHKGETIKIILPDGGRVLIIVKNVGDRKVKLALKGPDNVTILRGELKEYDE